MKKAFIIDAIRTPVGKRKGKLSKVRPDDLLVHCLKSLIQRFPSIDWNEVGDQITGCAMPEGEQGLNIGRSAALLAGLPDSVSGMTVNRFCASGLQAVAMAADKIRLGEESIMIASGVESMSIVPMGGNKPSFNPIIFPNEPGVSWTMGTTAEEVSKQFNILRKNQDSFAYTSHQRAISAIKNGAFKEEIIPFNVSQPYVDSQNNVLKSHDYVISDDEGPREDTSIEILAKLKPVFANRGSVTAGNSSQMSDGAGAVLLANEEAVKKYQLSPKAIFHGYAVSGVDPKIMGIGPVKAVPKLLNHHDVKLKDIQWIELNEAFAAQALAVIQELKLNQDIVNPQGGAIALGHPLGATGAIRTASIVSALQRNNLQYGLVTMCIGTGMGAAGLFERC